MIAEREEQGCAAALDGVGYTLQLDADTLSGIRWLDGCGCRGRRGCGKSRLVESMKDLFLILTIVAYGGSLALYLRFLSTGKEIAGRLGTLLLGLGLVAHYFALLERSRGLHTVPYHDLYGSMSLFGWLLALTYLGLELFHRQRSVGAFVLPFILVFFVAAHLAPADRLSPAPAQGSRSLLSTSHSAFLPMRRLRFRLCSA